MSARCRRRPRAADKQLDEQRGDVERAIHEVIENHVRLAGAQGFVTNLGGLITAAVAIPANITGLALIQCRMVAGIAHLRGYDLDDPRVRNAILVTLLGEDMVRRPWSRPRRSPRRRWRWPPLRATTPPRPGCRLRWSPPTCSPRSPASGWPSTVARRVPVVGGMVGAGADGYSTWQIGRYADRELLPRAKR